MKKFLLLLLVVLFVCSGCLVTEIKSPTYSKVEQAAFLESKTVALVIKVEDEDKTSVRAFCTGVWVGSNTIITAAHCVRGGDEEENPIGSSIDYATKNDIIDSNYKIKETPTVRTSKVIAVDEEHDLALLRSNFRAPDHLVASTSLGNIEIGQEVNACGHTAGFWWSFASGHVSAIRVQSGATPYVIKVIQSDAAVHRGNSGGGLFDEYGHLIGITSYLSLRAPQLSFFIHRDYIDAFLAKYTIV